MRQIPSPYANTASRAVTLKMTLFVSLVLALLISNAAACLAGRLARGLTLTASAALSTFAKIAGFNSIDSFHNKNLQSK